MTATDWDMIIRDGAMVMTTIIIPFGIWFYQKRTGVLVEDQERAAVYHAVDTLAGQLQTQVDLGKISPGQLGPDHTAVILGAAAALARIPAAAASQGVSAAELARLAIARVDTTPKQTLVLSPSNATSSAPAPAG